MPTIKKIFFKKISSILGLFIVCGFSLTIGAILLRVVYSAAFKQPNALPSADPHELGDLTAKISALEAKIGTPDDPNTAITVFGKIAGVSGGGGGGGSGIVAVANQKDLGGTKNPDLDLNPCKLQSYGSNDVQLSGQGWVRISDVGLSDSDSDGFKESPVVTKNTLWLSVENHLIESTYSNYVFATERAKFKCVFKISGFWSGGNLGGIDGADNKCQSYAANAGLYGNYKAWLSDLTSSPSDRFTKSSLPYINTAGDIVANNWSDLTDGSIKYPGIFYNEVGLNAPGAVWTGTNAWGGREGFGDCSQDFCGCWSGGDSVSNQDAMTGITGSFNVDWTMNGDNICSTAGSLYCFEQ